MTKENIFNSGIPCMFSWIHMAHLYFIYAHNKININSFEDNHKFIPCSADLLAIHTQKNSCLDLQF